MVEAYRSQQWTVINDRSFTQSIRREISHGFLYTSGRLISSLHAQGMASQQLQGGYAVHAGAPTGSLATVFKTHDDSAKVVLQCYYEKSSPQWMWMQRSAWIQFVGVAFQ